MESVEKFQKRLPRERRGAFIMGAIMAGVECGYAIASDLRRKGFADEAASLEAVTRQNEADAEQAIEIYGQLEEVGIGVN